MARSLKTSNGILQKDQTLLQALLKHAPYAHILIDQEGLVVSWNAAAEAIFGWSSEEAVGKAWEKLIIPPAHRESSLRVLRNLGNSKTGPSVNRKFETAGWHKDGCSFPIEMMVASINKGVEGSLFSVFIQDITQRKRVERGRSVDLCVSQLLASAASLEDVGQDILRTICDLLGWKVGCLWKVDKEAQVLRYVTGWKAPQAQTTTFIESTKHIAFSRGVGLPGRVWESGKVEWISDVTLDSNFPRAPFAEAEGFHAAVAFPVKAGDAVQAVFEFFSDAVQTSHQQMESLVFDRLASAVSMFLTQQLVQRQLRISEALLSSIIYLVEDAVITVDESQHIVFLNRGAEHMFGYAADELLGRSLSVVLPDMVHGERHSACQLDAEWASEKCSNERKEMTARRKNGEEFPAEAGIAKVTVEGQTTYTIILRDISRRKQEEQALKKAKALAEQEALNKRAILSAVKAFFIVVSEDGVVCEWTGQAEQLLGIAPLEAIGRPLQDLPLSWNKETVQETISLTTRTMRAVCLDKLRLSTHESRQRFLGLTVTPLCLDSGVSVILMGEDITERLEVERELIQAQKLESIGQLAAGIAHEINTPTQFVWDNLHFLSDAFADLLAVLTRQQEVVESVKTGACAPELIEACEAEVRRADLDYLQDEIPKALGQTTEGVERIATIVRAMKEFAHPDRDEMTSEDLNRAIANTVTVARNEWKYVADVTMDLASDLPSVPCLLGQFNQVILNIIVNAAHAIGDVVGNTGRKGVISIVSRRVDNDAEIRITDTGAGIPENIRHKIFDPFFTTKEVGKGTGQGLAIARSVVVDKHHGTIRVESEVGKGTTFIIRLPLNRGGQAGEMEPAA